VQHPRKLNPEERVSQSVIGHTHSLMYNRELTITLVYKYKVKNSRVLIKVFLK